MSGQRANPKYKSNHFPWKDTLVTKFPSKSIRDHGPPMAGLPATIYWRQQEKPGTVKATAAATKPKESKMKNKRRRESVRTV